MSDHKIHEKHDHTHGAGCGHTPIAHGGHTDYAHDGHLHRPHDGHVDECAIGVDASNPAACTPAHSCNEHPKTHNHGPGCGHEAIPHGDHVDYLVGGHLHHGHDGHCDDHGALRKG
jgi:hypothetical protein